MREVLHVLKALKWYNNHSPEQYAADQVNKYDHLADVLTQRKQFAHFLLEHLPESCGRTLEIASGTGLVSQVLQGKVVDIVFSDLSREALALLKSRAENNSAILQTDFTHNPFKDNSFQTIVNVGGYRYVDINIKTRFWSEMYRLLDTNGHLVIGQFFPRLKPIRGSNIENDLHAGIPFKDFSIEKSAVFPVILHFKLMRVKVGEYKLYILKKDAEYGKNS